MQRKARWVELSSMFPCILCVGCLIPTAHTDLSVQIIPTHHYRLYVEYNMKVLTEFAEPCTQLIVEGLSSHKQRPLGFFCITSLILPHSLYPYLKGSTKWDESSIHSFRKLGLQMQWMKHVCWRKSQPDQILWINIPHHNVLFYRTPHVYKGTGLWLCNRKRINVFNHY